MDQNNSTDKKTFKFTRKEMKNVESLMLTVSKHSRWENEKENVLEFQERVEKLNFDLRMISQFGLLVVGHASSAKSELVSLLNDIAFLRNEKDDLILEIKTLKDEKRKKEEDKKYKILIKQLRLVLGNFKKIQDYFHGTTDGKKGEESGGAKKKGGFMREVEVVVSNSLTEIHQTLEEIKDLGGDAASAFEKKWRELKVQYSLLEQKKEELEVKFGVREKEIEMLRTRLNAKIEKKQTFVFKLRDSKYRAQMDKILQVARESKNNALIEELEHLDQICKEKEKETEKTN